MAVNRRPRRRSAWWPLIAVLITVVVVLANAARQAHPSQAETVLAYLDRVRPEIQRSADQGSDVADVRAHAATLGRDGITGRLDRVVAQTATTLEVISRLSPPPSLRLANAYLVATVGARARAASDVRSGMRAALAEGTPDAAVQELTKAGEEMALSDQTYALFADALPVRAIPRPPASTWVSDPNLWSAQEVAVFVAELRSSTSLIPVNDLAVVTFTTNPAPIGNDGAMVVFPPAKGMQVSIVVANVGNQPEKHATVTATLFTNGANTTETVKDFVDLAPGQESALTIGPLHPISGTTGTLTVAISPAPAETNLANNTQQEMVEVR